MDRGGKTQTVSADRLKVAYTDPQTERPSQRQQNGVIKYYTVKVTEVETGTVFQYTEYSNYITLSSLHPAYTYEFTIAAFTVALGPFSQTFDITTAEEGGYIYIINSSA